MLVHAHSNHIHIRAETFRLSVAVRWKVGAAPTETPSMIVPQHDMWSSTARKDDTPLIKSFTHRAYQYTLTFGAYALMRRPMQPITLLAARAPGTAALTMVLLFLAAPPHCCSAMFRAGAPQCKEYLEIHRNPHHVDSKGLLAVGKRRAAPFCRNALP